MSTHCALAFIMFQEQIELGGHCQAWKTRVLSRPSFVPPHTERHLGKGCNIWLAGCSASDQERQFKVEAWFWLQVKSGSGEGNGNPLQYSCLENPMDGGAWWAAVPGVAKCRTRLSDFTFTFHFHALEKEMATHSSVLAWRIPRTAEPGGLPSMESHRVGHDWSDLAAAASQGH